MLLDIFVKPNKTKRKLVIEDNKYVAYLTSRPVHNEANKELIDLVARHFAVAKSDVNIVHGLKSKRKTVEIGTR